MKTGCKIVALFCIMDRSETVFVFRRTVGSKRLEFMVTQPWNIRLPCRGTARSPVGNHGTKRSHFGKENLRLQILKPQVPTSRICGFPEVGSVGSYFEDLRDPEGWNPCFPMLEPRAPISRNYRFPKVGAHVSQPWKHRFLFRGTAVSLRLEMVGAYVSQS